MATPASARWIIVVLVALLRAVALASPETQYTLCALPIFDGNGNLVGQSFCSSFTLLTR